MNRTEQLGRIGQSVWLDNITRDLLDSGRLEQYISKLSVTGLTSNPSIYDKAIGGSADYDEAIKRLAASGASTESIFFELALDDLRRAADLFLPVHRRTNGVDGFVSLEVSPLLANDATTTASEAVRLHGLAGRPNFFIKIPGTTAGLKAIEETIFAGVPSPCSSPPTSIWLPPRPTPVPSSDACRPDSIHMSHRSRRSS